MVVPARENIQFRDERDAEAAIMSAASRAQLDFRPSSAVQCSLFSYKNDLSHSVPALPRRMCVSAKVALND